MTLRSQIETDASLVFLSTDDFAETVTYYPHTYYNATSRSERSISAVVIRESITVLGEDGDTVLPVYEVHVENDSTDGISSDELDIGGDQIGLPPRDGKAAERKTITRLMTQDHGMLVLECR
jgi:hypothetical protein